jgi:phosphate transport system protein
MTPQGGVEMTIQARTKLDQELAKIDADIMRLASMVSSALDNAMEALSTRNAALARSVVATDEQINALRYAIEQDALMVLATQQPAAGDLRTVVASMHVASEMERMGDHASGIARLVDRLVEEPDIDSLHKLPKMAKRAHKMINQSVEAYIERDPEKAKGVFSRDDKMDRHYNRLFRETLEEMRDEDYVRRATYLLWVGHNLERMGDRAINVAERVIFMTTGAFVEDEVTFD